MTRSRKIVSTTRTLRITTLVIDEMKALKNTSDTPTHIKRRIEGFPSEWHWQGLYPSYILF